MEELQKFKPIHISRRVTEGLKNALEEGYLKNFLGLEKVKDYIVASCVLPKARIDEENYKMYAAEIKNLCTGELSKEILNQIDNGKDIDFWRR